MGLAELAGTCQCSRLSGKPALFCNSLVTHVESTGDGQTLQFGGVRVQVVLDCEADRAGVLANQFLAAGIHLRPFCLVQFYPSRHQQTV